MPPDTSRSRALRVTTVAVLFTFGCASVRTPATVFPEVIPVHDGTADPQLALWVEGGEAPTPAEQQAAAERAQRALVEAAQGVEAPGGEGILVVRAQGLTRTSGRRSNQVAGAVGLAVGIVVVVAVVILAIAEGKGGGGGRAAKGSGARAAPAPSRSGAGAAAGGAVARGAGRAAPTPGVPAARLPRPVRPGTPRGPVVARPAPRPHPAPPPHAAPPRYPHDGVYVWGDPWVSWNLYVDLTPPPTPYPYPAPSGDGFQQPVDAYVVAPAGEAPPADELAAEDALAAEDEVAEEDELAFEAEQAPPELTELRLGPPEPLPLADRGFFAGDDLMLELIVVDRETGEPRLRKLARKDVDPTDAAAVKAFLREAVAEKAGWEPVVATVAPAAS